MSKASITEVEAALPNLGFHGSFLRLAQDYGGAKLIGGIKVARGIGKC